MSKRAIERETTIKYRTRERKIERETERYYGLYEQDRTCKIKIDRHV